MLPDNVALLQALGSSHHLASGKLKNRYHGFSPSCICLFIRASHSAAGGRSLFTSTRSTEVQVGLQKAAGASTPWNPSLMASTVLQCFHRAKTLCGGSDHDKTSCALASSNAYLQRQVGLTTRPLSCVAATTGGTAP